VLHHPDTTSDDQVFRLFGQPPSPATLRGLEVGALLQAATALHLDGLLTDAEYRAKRRRLADQL
jgi:hypothetical protein